MKVTGTSDPCSPPLDKNGPVEPLQGQETQMSQRNRVTLRVSKCRDQDEDPESKTELLLL